MINDVNRKDAKPQETVQKIRNILNENGIDTRVITSLNYKDMWCSNRVEFTKI